MDRDEAVPADMVILASEESSGICYIETADLDGETNLKYRQSLEVTQEMIGGDCNKMMNFQGEVHCEAPNNNLAHFDGRMTLEGQIYSLSNENLLLRGCTVRNTKWAIGLVVFTGRQTKIMKNAGKTTLKRTKIDLDSNKYFLGLFLYIIFLLVATSVLGFIFESNLGEKFKDSYSYWLQIPGIQVTPLVIAAVQLFAYLILLQTLVPLALYLTFESIQLILSRGFINSDPEMYDEESDTPAQARTTSLNEDLGQIEYIFT